MIALLASVGGGIVSFVLSWRVMSILSDHANWRSGLTPQAQVLVILRQLDALKMMATGALTLMGISLVGLWFVMGKRSIEIGAGKFRAAAGGGQDEPADPATPAPISRTTTTTETILPVGAVPVVVTDAADQTGAPGQTP